MKIRQLTEIVLLFYKLIWANRQHLGFWFSC